MSELDVTHLPVLRLKRNEDRRLQAGHLWVFSNEVDTQQTPLNKFKPGELVRVLAHNDRALGLAYANPASLITARLLETWKIPDARWFEARLRAALALRERLYSEPYYRAVYGEADGLPGLVIDRYGGRCVAQIGTAGMELMKPHIRAAAERVFECETLIFKNDGSARELEGLPAYVEAAKGRLEDSAEVAEGGLRFRGAARRRPEDRLVLRPVRQPPRAQQVCARRGAGARCVQLCGRLGRARRKGRRRRGGLRRQLRAGTRARGAKRAPEFAVDRHPQGRCLRRARGARGRSAHGSTS